jgi:hypothetical protein
VGKLLDPLMKALNSDFSSRNCVIQNALRWTGVESFHATPRLKHPIPRVYFEQWGEVRCVRWLAYRWANRRYRVVLSLVRQNDALNLAGAVQDVERRDFAAGSEQGVINCDGQRAMPAPVMKLVWVCGQSRPFLCGRIVNTSRGTISETKSNSSARFMPPL